MAVQSGAASRQLGEQARVCGDLDDSKILRRPFLWVAIATFLVAAVATAVVYGISAYSVWHSDLGEKHVISVLVVARMTQVIIASILGLSVTLVGVILAWLGIVCGVDCDTRVVAYWQKSLCAAPGILLVICGTILLGICISKPVTDATDGKSVIEYSFPTPQGK